MMRPFQGVPVPLFPWNKLACSPVPQKSKICFMFPVPEYCLCSPVPLKIWPLFPCFPEINTLFPLFPKTPGRALMISSYKMYYDICLKLKSMLLWVFSFTADSKVPSLYLAMFEIHGLEWTVISEPCCHDFTKKL